MSILDDIGGALGRSLNEADRKSQISKARYDLDQANAQRDAVLTDIGRILIADESNRASLTEKCPDQMNAIAAFDQQIEAINQFIMKMENMAPAATSYGAANQTITCPNCGAVISSTSAFCQACGSPVQSAPEPKQSNTCPSCGAVVEDDAAFCANCGTKL